MKQSSIVSVSVLAMVAVVLLATTFVNQADAHPLAPTVVRLANTDGEYMYKGFPMSTYLLCASIHCEACAPSNHVPGPCLYKDECEVVACRPDLPGSCVTSPDEPACDVISCDPVNAQRRQDLAERRKQHFM